MVIDYVQNYVGSTTYTSSSDDWKFYTHDTSQDWAKSTANPTGYHGQSTAGNPDGFEMTIDGKKYFIKYTDNTGGWGTSSAWWEYKPTVIYSEEKIEEEIKQIPQKKEEPKKQDEIKEEKVDDLWDLI